MQSLSKKGVRKHTRIATGVFPIMRDMKKTGEKILSLILVFAFLLCLIPDVAIAAEKTIKLPLAATDFMKNNPDAIKCTNGIQLDRILDANGTDTAFSQKKIDDVYMLSFESTDTVIIDPQTKNYTKKQLSAIDAKSDTLFRKNTTYKLTTLTSFETTATALVAKGIEIGNQSTGQYYFIGVNNDKLYGIIVHIEPSKEVVSKTELERTIKKVTESSAEKYYQSEDRYNGNDVSREGFWQELLPVLAKAQNVEQNSFARQDDVNKATQELAAAISKLIPSTQANTTMLYEALQGLLTENAGYTAVSWDNYVKAKETAQTLFDGLFEAGKDGKRAATDQNTAANQGKIENAATVLKAAKADLLGSKGLEERLLLWNSAAQWLLAQDQQVQKGQYSNAQDWNAAYANLGKAIEDGDGYQTQSKYNAYTSSIVALSAAYYNLQDSNTSDITVHVRVADNFGAMFPEYAIKDAKTATFDQNVTLGQGNKTISALLSAMRYDDTPITKTPSKGTQYGEGWKNPEVMVYINGTLAVNRTGSSPRDWQGYIGKNADGKLDTSTLNFDVQLHDGDDIVILRAQGPGYNYYGDVAAGGAAYNFYYKSLALLAIQEDRIEVEAGKPFSLTVTRTSAAAEETKTTRSVADVSLFVSETQETKEAAQAAPALEAVGSKTDANGKATTTLYKEGWYRLATVDVTPQTPTIGNNNGDESGGNFPNLAAGDYVLVYVTPSADTSAAACELTGRTGSGVSHLCRGILWDRCRYCKNALSEYESNHRKLDLAR